MVLVGGRLYALAHGVRQKLARFGVAAGAAVQGVDDEITAGHHKVWSRWNSPVVAQRTNHLLS